MVQLIEQQNAELRELLYDIPALFTLYAINHDGHITKSEERKAKQILHVETYTGLSELKAYFHEVEKSFIDKLHQYDEMLPEDNDERHDRIREILAPTIPFFESIDRKKLNNFASAINTFVNNVVKSNKSLMSEFALPIFTQYLERVNKILFREVVGIHGK